MVAPNFLSEMLDCVRPNTVQDVRKAVENALAGRISTVFAQNAYADFERVSTGITALDELTGGLPRGALTEICGPASSGRTSAMLGALAQATQQGEACCLVDVTDAFDPQSAAGAGVDLERVLWVRCGGERQKAEGKRQKEPIQNSKLKIQNWEGRRPMTDDRRLSAIEQALKVTDLVLQGGGFGLVVVDMGDVPVRVARRVPLTSWFRFRRAVEKTRTVLLVVEQEANASTCASLVLKLGKNRTIGKPGHRMIGVPEPSHSCFLAGFEINAEVLRTPGKKRPQRVRAGLTAKSSWQIG